MEYLSFMYISKDFIAYVSSSIWVGFLLAYLHNNKTQMLSD